MVFPSLKVTKELTDKISKLEEIENTRSEDEEKIINQFFKKEISQKQLISLLREKKIQSISKKTDIKAVHALVDYNKTLAKLSENLQLQKIPIYSIENRSTFKRILKNLFTKKTKKIKPKKVEVKKDIDTKKETEIKKDTKIETKKEKKDTNIFDRIFKKREALVTKVEEKHEIKPTFEPPKELLPENYQVLIHGFAYAFIRESENERIYVVAEPELTEEEERILKETRESLINKISLADLTDESQMYTLVEKIFTRNKIKLEKEQKDKIVYYIIRQVSGLDKIEPLMHDPLIEDIECDGIGIPIFIVHRKYGHIVTNIVLDTENELQQFIIKMAHLCKSYVSYASPLLDAILPDGSRVNATLTSNVSTRGPTFTIRKFPQKPLTTIDLINSETITPEIVSYLWTLLEFKKNMILIGPTAGGKTTLLNVISSFIPEAQRVVSIEDTREINLLLNNWIPQITRSGFGPPDQNGKRYGEVNMNDLLKESFRQRPDYLIIGEVRGEEMALMFQGMASGHCSLSTVHSKSVEALITRITTPPISLDPSLITSLDIVIVTGFTGVGEEGKREIKEIDEIKGYNSKDKKVEYNPIYKSIDKFKEKSATSQSDLFHKETALVYNSDVLKEICTEHNISKKKMTDIIMARTKFIEALTKNPPKDYVEFNKLLKNYKRKEDFTEN
ncbi:Flp pilus assembly complex ATPase component [archaeon]|nr:Flp pilus assembly complex ATPase component [archaeon]NCP79060.1 Flp pilus assembly complex ATPase component [archaeon]NCQ06827.1 Flp pilus assembly complex ATPase component [archaeon]NCQ50623.1 Flp pilus assembly complex ATPase component [archaeon]NCT58065.1 Flp pilus assembly complex ATPase component [archaeon]